MRRNLSIMLVVSLGLVILAGCNSAEKQTASSAGPVSSAGPLASPPKTGTPTDGIRRITVSELRDLLDKNQAFVVDVRDDASFKKGHIRGAKLIPVADVLNHTGELPKDKLIVTYCS